MKLHLAISKEKIFIDNKEYNFGMFTTEKDLQAFKIQEYSLKVDSISEIEFTDQKLKIINDYNNYYFIYNDILIPQRKKNQIKYDLEFFGIAKNTIKAKYTLKHIGNRKKLLYPSAIRKPVKKQQINLKLNPGDVVSSKYGHKKIYIGEINHISLNDACNAELYKHNYYDRKNVLIKFTQDVNNFKFEKKKAFIEYNLHTSTDLTTESVLSSINNKYSAWNNAYFKINYINYYNDHTFKKIGSIILEPNFIDNCRLEIVKTIKENFEELLNYATIDVINAMNLNTGTVKDLTDYIVFK